MAARPAGVPYEATRMSSETTRKPPPATTAEPAGVPAETTRMSAKSSGMKTSRIMKPEVGMAGEQRTGMEAE